MLRSGNRREQPRLWVEIVILSAWTRDVFSGRVALVAWAVARAVDGEVRWEDTVYPEPDLAGAVLWSWTTALRRSIDDAEDLQAPELAAEIA